MRAYILPEFITKDARVATTTNRDSTFLARWLTSALSLCVFNGVVDVPCSIEHRGNSSRSHSAGLPPSCSNFPVRTLVRPWHSYR